MKKKKTKIDTRLLKHWKNVSTKGKLDWLASALYFGKFKQFKNDLPTQDK